MTEKNDFLQQVEKTAELARLNLSSEKKAQYAQEIKSVLEHFKDINDLEVGQVENFDHYVLKENQVRADKKEDFSFSGKEIIKKSFPERNGEFLKVKTVL